MKRIFIVMAAVAVIAVFGLFAGAGAIDGADNATNTSTGGENASRWIDNARAIDSSAITEATVGNLTLAWSWNGSDAGASGPASVPIVEDGTVYIQDFQATLFALDLETGMVDWRVRYNATDGAPGENQTVSPTATPTTTVTVTATITPTATETGNQSGNVTPTATATTPIPEPTIRVSNSALNMSIRTKALPMAFADGTLYVPVPANALPDGNDTGNATTGEIAAVDAVSGETLWAAKLDGLATGEATVVGSLLFTASDRGTVYAFNRSSGREVWNASVEGRILASPAVTDDMIIWSGIADSAPAVFAFGLAPGDNQTGGNVTMTPTVTATVSPNVTLTGNETATPTVTATTGNMTETPTVTATTGNMTETPTATMTTVTVPTTAETTTTAVTTTITPGGAVTVNLTASNLAFDNSTITVPAGSQVTLNFSNQDSGIPHNVAFYTDASAAQAIFQGATITGPATTTYTFTAPTQPGTYFFRCDVHPTTMTGQFIVQ